MDSQEKFTGTRKAAYSAEKSEAKQMGKFAAQ